MITTQTIPDNTQLQLFNDVVNCNSCKGNYAVQVALDLPNVKTKCPWCERVQAYTSAGTPAGPLSGQFPVKKK